jgi:hypothetical protein
MAMMNKTRNWHENPTSCIYCGGGGAADAVANGVTNLELPIRGRHTCKDCGTNAGGADRRGQLGSGEKQDLVLQHGGVAADVVLATPQTHCGSTRFYRRIHGEHGQKWFCKGTVADESTIGAGADSRGSIRGAGVGVMSGLRTVPSGVIQSLLLSGDVADWECWWWRRSNLHCDRSCCIRAVSSDSMKSASTCSLTC